jgi:site-specific DNA-cytosine methylase
VGHNSTAFRFEGQTEEATRFLLDRRTNSKGPGWRANPDAPQVPTALVDVGERPAPTITSQTGAQWVVSEELLEERRAGGEQFDAHWVEDRPATVVASREIVQHPGATKNRFNDSDKTRNDGLRITEAEGGILQGFPPDYSWEGSTKGKRWEQIGNVVCPPVARRIMGELLGVEPEPLPWHAYAFTA